MLIKKQAIKKMKIEELKPNPWNPNQMNKETSHKLKKNIKAFGYVQPIVAAKMGGGEVVIVDGEHRWKAMQEETEPIDVVLLEGYTEQELKLLTINLNELKGNFQPNELAGLIAELDQTFKNKLDDVLAYTKSEKNDYLEILKQPISNTEGIEEELKEIEEDKPVFYRFEVNGEKYTFVIDGQVDNQEIEKALKYAKGIDRNYKFHNVCSVFNQLMQKANKKDMDKSGQK